jgi:acetyltransferase-like isoleucine patch superfamily enzyme
MGKHCQISENVKIFKPEQVTLGCNVVINDDALIQACEDAVIIIGSFVTLSYGAYAITGGFKLPIDDHRSHTARSINIADYAWVGARAIIMPGVSVGRGAIVAAGAIVTEDVPPWTIVAGSPARVVRKLDASERPGIDKMRA